MVAKVQCYPNPRAMPKCSTTPFAAWATSKRTQWTTRSPTMMSEWTITKRAFLETAIAIFLICLCLWIKVKRSRSKRRRIKMIYRWSWLSRLWSRHKFLMKSKNRSSRILQLMPEMWAKLLIPPFRKWVAWESRIIYCSMSKTMASRRASLRNSNSLRKRVNLRLIQKHKRPSKMQVVNFPSILNWKKLLAKTLKTRTKVPSSSTSSSITVPKPKKRSLNKWPRTIL